MKKLLVILALPLFLMSCNSSSSGGTTSANIAALTWTPFHANFVNAFNDLSTLSTYYVCDSGSISVDESTITVSDCLITENECNEEDLIYSGTLTYTDSGSYPNITGTLSITGLVTASCSVNIREGESFPLEGTFCGNNLEDLESIDSDTYCEAI